MLLFRKVWGNNTLVPLYDNEDSVCGIIYNDAAYYFYKNLQGDVIVKYSVHTNEYYAAVNALFVSTYTVKKRERTGYIYGLWVSIACFLTAVDISINQ